jgi:hypothetical protein
MRLSTGLCCLLLAILTGCETIPETVKIEVDDRLIELKRKPPPVPAVGQSNPPALDPATDEAGEQPQR